MRIHQLDHVALHVRNVEESVRFYRDVLELEPLPRPDFDFPGAWFRLGMAQELHLIGDRTQPVISSNRGNHFALMVYDIDGFAAALTRKGIAFRGPSPRPDGASQIFLQDPDGHVIELCTSPTSEED